MALDKIKLLLINDLRLLREAWAELLGMQELLEVVGETGCLEEAKLKIAQLQPHMILLDWNMQPLQLPATARQLRKLFPTIKIIVFTATATHALSTRLARMPSVAGYITKESPSSELLDAIEDVYDNNRYLSSDVRHALRHPPDNNHLHLLTKRETQVVMHIRKGLRSQEIAEVMNIAIKTVEVHRYNVLHKLQLKNTAALVNYVNRFA